MAFAIGGLRRFDYGGNNGTTSTGLFAYGTADAAATVEASDYFNSATALLQKGDIIFASMVVGGTPVLKSYIVTSATGAAAVTVALQTTTAG